MDEKNETVKRAGLVKVVENVDSIGKVISNPDVSVAAFNFEETDTKLQKPEQFTEKKSFLKLQSVNDISVWYDSDDRESYAIIQCTDTDNSQYWTKAINLLYYTKGEAFKVRDMVFELLATYFGKRTGNTNVFYPLFSRITVVWENNEYEGLLVSTDAHSKRKYGVIFYDDEKQAVFHQDVGATDVRNFDLEILYSVDMVNTYSSYTEPNNHRTAMTHADAPQWIEAERIECHTMFEEKKCLKSVQHRDIPSDAVIMEMRWVFKVKRNSDGSLERHKARLVVKGFRQIPGVHFDETFTFSPTSSIGSLRFILTMSVNFLLKPYQMDVKSAFLNSKPRYDNYVRLPEGFTYQKSQFAYLLKNIYGTRDAARGWYEDQHAFLMKTYPNLIRCTMEP